MIHVRLDYGKTGLDITLPEEHTTVIEPKHLPPLLDQSGALRNAIRNPLKTPPLKQLVRPHQKVAIAVCDITRPMPSSTVLPVLLNELSHIPDENITIIVATGTHRANSPQELQSMLGGEVSNMYKVINHNAFDQSSLKYLGCTSDGIPIWINRIWLESDVRITTGFVEPHFFAGFSGGPKMVAPGMAGFSTIMGLHSAALIAHPKSTWGITDGNPVHEAIRSVVGQAEVDFSIDVTINRERMITSVYAGDLLTVHKAACEVALHTAMRPVKDRFDIVITSNSGYPLDMNLYQTVKGMSAAAQIVREGGTIICVSECIDGIPDHGEYKEILASRKTPKKLLEMINSVGYNHHDQWEVQIQAQIQQKARVFLKSTYLTAGEVKAAHLEPINDLQETILELINENGTNVKVCVLPEGPQTIPYLRDVNTD